MTVHPELGQLLGELPLSPRWATPQPFVETVDIRGCRLGLVGLSAESEDGELACGSAAAVGELPLARAYFELLERTSILDALAEPVPERALWDESRREVGWCARDVAFPSAPPRAPWRYAFSNGVASHRTWLAACASARLELAERDAVLRCWYGCGAPTRQPLGDQVPANLRALFDFEAVSFHTARRGPFQPLVAGVFAFPKQPDGPIAYGFSARFTLDGALRDATRECLQSLGFLWGEALPEREPELQTAPAYHQEYYLHSRHHDRLRRWLDGAHADLRAEPDTGLGAVSAYVDLTPPHLRGRIAVAKALADFELPLTFGLGHPCFRAAPAELRVHPIT